MHLISTKTAWMMGIAVLLAVGLSIGIWFTPGREMGTAHRRTIPPATAATTQATEALRIALIPERDIFAQRRRYKALSEYLARRLDRPVELVSLNTYQAVLQEFAEKQIDGAFLGSFVSVLAIDRYGAQVLVKPELPGPITTYRGVIFVPESSPVRRIEDLAGKSLVLLKATTAADLFPVSELNARGMLGSELAPRILWVGTHDEVINEVMSGRADAGAVKDLVLDDLLRIHKSWNIRRLAVGEPAPNNALVVRADLDAGIRQQLRSLLLEMNGSPEGQAALGTFEANRFVPCEVAEYQAIYDRVEQLGPNWSRLEVSGPPPAKRGAAVAGDGADR